MRWVVYVVTCPVGPSTGTVLRKVTIWPTRSSSLPIGWITTASPGMMFGSMLPLVMMKSF